MTQLSIEQIIKMIIAVFIFLVVVLGIYLAFRYYIIPYFSGFNFGGKETGKLILALIR